MTGIILNFPGMQPTRNESKMSVCTSTHISITGRGSMFTLLTEIIHHDGQCFACWLCFQSGFRWHSSRCKEFSHFCLDAFLPEPSALQPGHALPITQPLCYTLLAPLAGERGRGTSLDITTSFLQFWCCFTSSHSYQAFFWLMHLSK